MQTTVTVMQEYTDDGALATDERVLVCVGRSPASAALVRYAHQLASRLRAPWTAIHIETSDYRHLASSEHDEIAEVLRLAEQLGATCATEAGQIIAKKILAYAIENKVTHIIVGRSERPRPLQYLHRSLGQDLLRRADHISIHVIDAAKGPKTYPKPAARPSRFAMTFDPGAYAVTTAVIGFTLGIALLLHQFVNVLNIALVYLMAVLVVAAKYGLGPSLYACLLSVLAYNFFSLPPLYTFTIAEPENVLTLVTFLAIAIIGSNLAAGVHAQALALRSRSRTTEELLAFSRKIAAVTTLDNLLMATTYQIASMLELRVIILMLDHDGLVVKASYPHAAEISGGELAAAKWCWANDRAAGRGTDAPPVSKRFYLPLRTGRGGVGVLGLDQDRPGVFLSSDDRHLLDALMDLAALGIERITLQAELDKAKLQAESERVRSALLTSISHDLGTPLASIIGAASSLKSVGARYTEEQRSELVSTILEESERLNRFVGNLLDMTRLESGAITPKLEWIDLSEIVATALRRVGKMVSHHSVKVNISAELPMLHLDFILFEQVMVNLLDNAAKYAESGSLIEIRARQERASVVIHVLDEGKGIPLGQTESIFEKFHRVDEGDRRRVGTGLGLAICRGFVEVMGGTILARNRTDRSGADFIIGFPTPLPEREAVP